MKAQNTAMPYHTTENNKPAILDLHAIYNKDQKSIKDY